MNHLTTYRTRGWPVEPVAGVRSGHHAPRVGELARNLLRAPRRRRPRPDRGGQAA